MDNYYNKLYFEDTIARFNIIFELLNNDKGRRGTGSKLAKRPQRNQLGKRHRGPHVLNGSKPNGRRRICPNDTLLLPILFFHDGND